jgi:beta-phosphoglucomutase-like phosphatase (HAD superfamily)
VKLILLDCDGVLVDSEILVTRKFIQLLSERGVSITEDGSLKEFTGLSISSIYKLLNAKHNNEFDDAAIDYIQSKIQNELAANVKSTLGVEQLLDVLTRENISFCIVSSGSPERIRTSLRTAGLLPYFKDKNIFSSTMVTNGKPAPDLFLYAANEFNYTPDNCVVIEDSHFGIQAANAAGMDSIAFFGGQHAQRDWYKSRVLAQNPTFVCEDMADVFKSMQCLLGKSYVV